MILLRDQSNHHGLVALVLDPSLAGWLLARWQALHWTLTVDQYRRGLRVWLPQARLSSLCNMSTQDLFRTQAAYQDRGMLLCLALLISPHRSFVPDQDQYNIPSLSHLFNLPSLKEIMILIPNDPSRCVRSLAPFKAISRKMLCSLA